MKQVNSPHRIALFILDSALSNGAVSRFIGSHSNNIRLVIASNPFRKHGGGKSLLRQFRYSGARFFSFLTYNFLVFPLLLKANYWLCKIIGKNSSFIPIKQHCQRYDIGYRLCNDINDAAMVDLLRELDIDLIITCFFDQILHSEIIRVPPRGCLNIHPGMLPDCRGVFPEFHTAAGKCTDFGITIHTVDDDTIDTGRILLRRNIDTSGYRSMLATGRRLLVAGLAALDEVLADLNSSLEHAWAQGAGYYYSFPSKADIQGITGRGYVLVTAKEIFGDISMAL